MLRPRSIDTDKAIALISEAILHLIRCRALAEQYSETHRADCLTRATKAQDDALRQLNRASNAVKTLQSQLEGLAERSTS